MDNLSGQKIKGYELQEQIAAGGFGAVYRARQSTVGREVAIKVILPELANKPDFIRRFEAEAQLIARLEHHFIVPLYDYWRDPDGAYLVMRYLRGGSLHDRIRKQGALSIEEAFNLLSQVAQGLYVAHRNQVVHRDIKPGNILLDEDGTGFLADFGIAKDHTTTESITDPDALMGSPEYLAPEQARSEPVTPQTDIYSLGVVLYEMLTGNHPFLGLEKVAYIFKHLEDLLPDITTLDDGIRNDVNDVIQKATAKDPQERFQDVMEMVEALRQAAQLNATPTPSSPIELLTPREQEVVQLIIAGKSNREIANILVLTEGTVKTYINRIYRKLNVRSRMQAIARMRDMDFFIDKPKTSISIGNGHLPEPVNPYKGLQAFQAADAPSFFGREKLTQKLLSRLEEKGEYQRFLSIVGPSGSGKSSVVKAGLIPALWRGDLPGSENWYIVDMLPGDRPMDKLEVALYRITDDRSLNLREQLERDEHGLLRVADMILPDDGSEILLVIDQFEEVFTLVENEEVRQHFLNLIGNAVSSKRSRVRVVVTLRADYYDRPLQYPEFGELMRSRVETVLPLGAADLERTIHEPASLVDVIFEDGLVSRIVSDVHYQPGALPLLQYALTELFERRDGRTLTLEAYQDIGGTGGALAKRADEIYLEYDEIGQELIRQMFLRLVTLGEGAEDTRRRTLRSELLSITHNSPSINSGSNPSEGVDMMNDIIDLFADSRLLSLDNDPATRTPTIEVAHEAILREWDRLRLWLNDSREDIRQQRIVAHAAAEWEAHDRDSSYLLHGARLEQVEAWHELTEVALTPLERIFIDDSTTERDRRKALDKERKARESTLEQRAHDRLRALVVVLMVGVLVAGTLTVYAFNKTVEAQIERDNANDLRDKAQSNFIRAERIRLSAQAQIALVKGEDVRVPALLAIRSLKLGYSPAADAALVAAVSRGFSRQVYVGHTGAVMSSIFTPNDDHILTASVDGTARLWDTSSGEVIQQFIGHNGMVNDAVFLSDEKHILTNGIDGTVRQWDIVTGQEVRRFPDHDSAVSALALSADGQYVVTSDESGSAYLWDVATTELMRQFNGHNDVVNSVAFSPDGQTIATGSFDRTVRLWDVNTGEELRRLEGHAGCVCTVAFSPDGEKLISGSTDSTARLWDVNTGEELRRFIGHTAFIMEVTFSPNGHTIATVSADNTIRLWDIETGEEVRQLLGHAATVSSVSFSMDGKFLLSGGGDNTARLWDVDYQDEPKTFQNSLATSSPHTFTTLMSMLSADGRSLVTGNASGVVQFWDVATGQVIRELVTKNDGLITDIALSPDGNFVLTSGSDDGIARLWDVVTGAKLQSYSGHTLPLEAVGFSTDGIWIVTASSDATARLWDTQSGKLLQEFIGHVGAIYAVTFSPDNRYIVTAGDDLTARLWDSESGVEIQQFAGHTSEIHSAVFSPDGRFVLTGSDDNTARLWDVNTGEETGRYSGHTLPVRTLAFSQDGDLIITGSDDKTARIWEVETGQVIRQFVGHSETLRSVTLSPDREFVVIGDIFQAYLWRLDIDDVIDLACTQLSADFSANERAIYDIVGEEDICTNN